VTRTQAQRLADALDLDVDDMAICHACLSFVSFELDSGNERKIEGWITRISPDLWAEGLEQPVRLALGRACERGVAHAEEALCSVEAEGSRSRIVRAIVRRLAVDLRERARGDLLKMGFQPWPPLELQGGLMRPN
jgi:hypothetical protein